MNEGIKSSLFLVHRGEFPKQPGSGEEIRKLLLFP
jgi:hypothetical protein